MKRGDYEALENYYKLVCEDISSQRARVGGDWVVAGVVLQKHQRDLIRSEHFRLSLSLILSLFYQEIPGSRVGDRDSDNANEKCKKETEGKTSKERR